MGKKITTKSSSKYSFYITAEEVREKFKQSVVYNETHNYELAVNMIFYDMSHSYHNHTAGTPITKMYWNKAKVDFIEKELTKAGFKVTVQAKNVQNNETGSVYYKVIISC